MDDKKDKIVDWKNYYSSIDKNTLNNLCSNTNIKNLIYLSSQVDLNPFNKKNKKWQLKNKEKIIKECEQYKKKEIKEFSYTLSNLAKLGSNNTSDVKNICKNYEEKLDNIDKIITCANNITVDNFTNKNHQTQISNGIEAKEAKKTKTTYLVEHEPNSLSNIVSFDIIGGNQEEQKQIKQKVNYFKESKEPKKEEPKSTLKISVMKSIKSPSESSENSDYLECYGNC